MWTDSEQQRKQRHSLRRESILQKAALCFNRKGYHGTTIDDIARELAISKAALYYYVKNKEELLFECHQLSLDLAMEGLRLGEMSGAAADEKLRIVLQYYIEGMTDRLEACVVLLEEGMLSPALHRRIVQRRDEFERRVRAIVEEGIKSAVFVDCDPQIVVFAMLGAVNWIPKWYRPQGRLSGKAISDVAAWYLVRGICKAQPNGDPERRSHA